VAVFRDRATNFIKEFTQTPEGIVCPHFWTLGHALGCPYACDYCYLKKTLRRTPKPELFTNVDKMVRDIEKWLLKFRKKKVLNAGELSETFSWENERPFIKQIIAVFADNNRNPYGHSLLFLTKCDDIGVLCGEQPSENVILSWSINAYDVSSEYEKLAPGSFNRLEAMRAAKAWGWRTRARIDPFLPVDGWKPLYKEIATDVALSGPERLTLGSLRWLPGLNSFSANPDMFNMAPDKDGSDNRGRVKSEVRSEAYAMIAKIMQDAGIPVGLCKETEDMWATMEAMGLVERGCCNCTP
jgi:DNA repair photolyase